MRLKHTENYSKRKKRAFLLFPKRVGGETRWLETASWEEMYHDFSDMGWWTADRWIDNEPEKIISHSKARPLSIEW